MEENIEEVEAFSYREIRIEDLQPGMILTWTSIRGRDAVSMLVREICKINNFGFVVKCLDSDGQLACLDYTISPDCELFVRILI